MSSSATAALKMPLLYMLQHLQAGTARHMPMVKKGNFAHVSRKPKGDIPETKAGPPMQLNNIEKAHTTNGRNRRQLHTADLEPKSPGKESNARNIKPQTTTTARTRLQPEKRKGTTQGTTLIHSFEAPHIL